MCLNNFFHLYIMIITDRNKVIQKRGLHIRETQDSSKPICICQQLHRISTFFCSFTQKKYQKKIGSNCRNREVGVSDQRLFCYLRWWNMNLGLRIFQRFWEKKEENFAVEWIISLSLLTFFYLYKYIYIFLNGRLCCVVVSLFFYLSLRYYKGMRCLLGGELAELLHYHIFILWLCWHVSLFSWLW